MAKKKIQRIAHIAAVFVFLIGGVQMAADGNLLVGGFSVVIGLVNLLAVIMSEKNLSYFPVILIALDTSAALVNTIFLYISGKNYLPYAWGLATLLYLFATIKVYQRSLSKSENTLSE